jgi:transcriptional regulator with XRE-family HTH domain
MRLKELRMQRGVTQQEVASVIGCSKNNYARYERGERTPDIEMFKALSFYFQKSIDYLVCNDWMEESHR